MKVLYEWKNHEIAGYSAVSMSEDYGYIDSMISGRKGWIYSTGLDNLSAVLVEEDTGLGRSGRSEARLKGYSIETEKIYTFKIKDIKKYIRLIDWPAGLDEQLYYANNPNARHHSGIKFKRNKEAR